ncbi:hypothetical protein ACLKA7_009867 [Drosophila subpalustris]
MYVTTQAIVETEMGIFRNPYWLGQLSEATSITVSQQAGGSCGKADGKWTYDKQVEWQLLVERVLVGQA